MGKSAFEPKKRKPWFSVYPESCSSTPYILSLK